MALVIEDGTNVSGANSFVTAAQFATWAGDRGYAVPSTPTVEQNAVRAMDFIKSVETDFGGERLYDDQALPFPRTGQYIYDVLVPDGTIPPEVRDLQFVVIKALNDGIDLFPTSSERALKRQKTGPLEKEWFDANISPTVTFIDAAMWPLTGIRNQFALTVRRI